MAEVLAAKGRNGQITFDGKSITITRDGFAARSTHGRSEKVIPIRQISGIQFKPNGGLTIGFIQFTLPGEMSNRATKGRRTLDASRDENAVTFTKSAEADFVTLKNAVQSAIADL